MKGKVEVSRMQKSVLNFKGPKRRSKTGGVWIMVDIEVTHGNETRGKGPSTQFGSFSSMCVVANIWFWNAWMCLSDLQVQGEGKSRWLHLSTKSPIPFPWVPSMVCLMKSFLSLGERCEMSGRVSPRRCSNCEMTLLYQSLYYWAQVKLCV